MIIGLRFGLNFRLIVVYLLVAVNCPRGMKYDDAGKKCVDCAVGYISTSESSRKCTKCPLGSSTLASGSKQCTGKESRQAFTVNGH